MLAVFPRSGDRKAMTEIRTERLLLRRARTSDLDAIHAILGDARAMRYWSTPPHETIEQSREWLANMIDSPDGAGEDFMIEHRGSVIGKAGCYRFPNVGYILSPDAWGQGFASEALSAVFDHVFAHHAIETLHADVDPRNPASMALLLKLGFEPNGKAERTWLVGDEWCNSVYFKLVRPDAISALSSGADKGDVDRG
jgi:ribosomal-protein-alanine N-acetyltransferase